MVHPTDFAALAAVAHIEEHRIPAAAAALAAVPASLAAASPFAAASVVAGRTLPSAAAAVDRIPPTWNTVAAPAAAASTHPYFHTEKHSAVVLRIHPNSHPGCSPSRAPRLLGERS